MLSLLVPLVCLDWRGAVVSVETSIAYDGGDATDMVVLCICLSRVCVAFVERRVASGLSVGCMDVIIV